VYGGCGTEKLGVQLSLCGVCSKLVREMLCRLQKTRMKSVEKRPSYDENSEMCNAHRNCIALFIDIERKLKKLNKIVKLTELDGVSTSVCR
jgi:hypothetical protein